MEQTKRRLEEGEPSNLVVPEKIGRKNSPENSSDDSLEDSNEDPTVEGDNMAIITLKTMILSVKREINLEIIY